MSGSPASSSGCALPRSARSSRRSTDPWSCSGPRASLCYFNTSSPFRRPTTARRRSSCSTPSLLQTRLGSRPTSSSGSGSSRARRASAVSSTIASCPPRRASRSARSASRRAATRGRSRSPASTIAVAPIAASVSSRSTGDELPDYDAELALEGKVVGRVTSAARDPEHGIVALAYVRREVPDDAELESRAARLARSRRYTHRPRARSSGDRALPCGGRGRTFESCRAHNEKPRIPGLSHFASESRLLRARRVSFFPNGAVLKTWSRRPGVAGLARGP